MCMQRKIITYRKTDKLNDQGKNSQVSWGKTRIMLSLTLAYGLGCNLENYFCVLVAHVLILGTSYNHTLQRTP